MKRASYCTRRHFLRSTLGLSAAVGMSPLLPACSSIGRIVDGDSKALTDRVVIIGAGLSGLVAARELKKNSVPFRLFEGQARVGGRCLTLDEFNPAAQSAELGAEWVSEDHSFVKNLCRELHIGLVDAPDFAKNMAFLYDGKILDGASLQNFLMTVDRRVAALRERLNDQQWGALSVEEMLSELKRGTDARALFWIRRLVQLEWGCEAQQISALMYFDRFHQSYSGLKKVLQSRMKIRGGTGLLANALYDRIAGVVPGQLVAFEHRLIEVDQTGDEIELTFQTPTGNFSVQSKVIIFALPFSILRHVQGIERLNLSEVKQKIIQELPYGQQSKLVSSFAQRFWNRKYLMMTGEIDSQWIWESSQVQTGPMQATRGLLTMQVGGKAAQMFDEQRAQVMKSDLSKFSLRATPEEDVIAKSWHTDLFARGGSSYFAPQQHLGYSSAIGASEAQGKLIFAGEHTSPAYMGTMNGAVESGMRAALEAIRMKSELKKKII